MTENKFLFLIGIISSFSFLNNTKMDAVYSVLTILIILMIIDQISEFLASKRESLDHPECQKYKWSNLKFLKGIYKKIGYMLTIFVAVTTDYILTYIGKELGVKLYKNTLFGFLVSVWFTANELLSIIKNANRMGAKLPKFLKNCLVILKKDLEQSEKTKKNK